MPHLGLFAQTDPIGYAASANLYAYVGGDPVNLGDPSGTGPFESQDAFADDPFVNPDKRPPSPFGQHSYDWGGQAGMWDEMAYADENAAYWSAVASGYMCSILVCNPSRSASLARPGFGDVPLSFAPLTSSEQATMNQVLNSLAFQAKSNAAWGKTMATGLEHGFFIWVNSGQIVYGRIWEGTSPRTMGYRWELYAKYEAGNFWATFHTHPGDWYGASGPSAFYGRMGELIGGDLHFNQIYGAIGIIRSRWSPPLVYGH